MINVKKIFGAISVLLCAGQAYAYNCAGVAQFSNGTSYSNNAIVQNGGSAYRCTVAGWCSVGGPYAPGSGWAWSNAWASLGACDGVTVSSVGVSSARSSVVVSSVRSSSSRSSVVSSTAGGGSCSAWRQGTNYYAGNVVSYNGSYFIAEYDNPGYDPLVSTWFWEPVGSCPGGSGGGNSSVASSTGGNTGNGFAAVVSEAQFNQMFPGRNSFYSYSGLVAAAQSFPGFANTGDIQVRKREAAAALANFSHETGGLVYINEIAQGEYCSGTATPCGVCAPGKRYYGRGPIQISWNYNYCTAGQALGLDLWANPDQVAQNSTTAWKTALWFWMTQSGAGYRPAHSSIVEGYGFGETIRTINGSLECNGGNSGQVQSRINEYQRFIQILGGTAGNNLSC